MSYASTILADAPFAYYPMQESSGTALTDSSGHGRNGVYGNTPGLGNATPLVVSDAFSVYFHSTGPYAYSSAIDGNGITPPWTLEFWFQPVVARVLMCSLGAASTGGPAIYLGTDGISIYKNDFATLLLLYNHTISAAVHHFVLTVDSSKNLIVYLDGVQIATAAWTTSGSSANVFNAAAYLGNIYTQNVAENLFLSEWASYDTALSSTRVLAHYTAGLPTAVLQTITAGACIARTTTAAISGAAGVMRQTTAAISGGAQIVQHASTQITAGAHLLFKATVTVGAGAGISTGIIQAITAAALVVRVATLAITAASRIAITSIATVNAGAKVSGSSGLAPITAGARIIRTTSAAIRGNAYIGIATSAYVVREVIAAERVEPRRTFVFSATRTPG